MPELKYIDRNGVELDLGHGGFYYTSPAIRSYAWIYDASGKKIKFSRKAVEKEITVRILVNDPILGIELRNRLYEVMDADVRAGQPGILSADGLQTNAFIFKSDKDNYATSDCFMEARLTALLPDPVWFRTELHRFFVDELPESPGGLNYPHDYPHDFGPMPPARTLDSGVEWASDFRLVAYGPASSPSLRIDGNLYQVSVDVLPGGYLVIDSREKVVQLIDPTGNIYNALSRRNKGSIGSKSYIFEKIKPGVSVVEMNNSFGFDLTIYHERSEPEWTL